MLVTVTHALRGEGFDATEDGTGRGTPLVAMTLNGKAGTRMDGESETFVADRWRVRRLTPTECERLQAMPDGWTAIRINGKVAPDGPRYKAIGNSWAVANARWIGDRIRTALDELTERS
jgi:DNA (cytosine-5)-methyltransferase 1